MPGQRELIVRGTVAAGSKEIVRTAAVEQPHPVLRERDEAGAGRLAASRSRATRSTSMRSPTGATPGTAAACWRDSWSPPFSDFGRTLMKVSQNLYAETMMRALSLSPGPASMEASRKVADATLARWGVPPGQYVVADGSGLSRMNYVSATMIDAHPHRDGARRRVFRASKPRCRSPAGTARSPGACAARSPRRTCGRRRARSPACARCPAISRPTRGNAWSSRPSPTTTPSPRQLVDAVVEAALERVISRPAPAPRH